MRFDIDTSKLTTRILVHPLLIGGLCGLFSPQLSFAQWLPTGATSGPIYYAGGSVGIGTANPQQTLEVNGGVRVAGNQAPTTGIGLEFAYVPTMAYIAAYNRTTSTYIPITVGASDMYEVPTSTWRIRNRSGADLLFVNASSGSVGIGTTNPQHLLHVAGVIGAQEVIVSSTGADYVFNPGYRLAPLTEVASYIQEHHHLPDIPSADDAQSKGVGEMQTKLLAKIEELTLHMIRAEERNGLRYPGAERGCQIQHYAPEQAH